MTDPIPAKLWAKLAGIARRHDIPLPCTGEIVKVVLGYSDEVATVTSPFPREAWENEDYRSGLLISMQHRIIEQALDRKAVPIALPTESLKYFAGFPGYECPEGDHDMIEVTLSVPIRYCVPKRAPCSCIGPSHSDLCPEWTLPI